MCGGHSLVCYELYIAYLLSNIIMLNTCYQFMSYLSVHVCFNPFLCKKVITYILKCGELCTDCIQF